MMSAQVLFCIYIILSDGNNGRPAPYRFVNKTKIRYYDNYYNMLFYFFNFPNMFR